MLNLNYNWGSNLTPPLPSLDFSNSYLNMPYSLAPKIDSPISNMIDLYAKAGDPTSMKISVDNHSLINSPSNYKLPEKKNAFGQTMSKIGSGLLTGVKGLGKGIGNFLTNDVVGLVIGASYDVIPTADKTVNETDLATQSMRSTGNKFLLSGAAGSMGIGIGAFNTAIDKMGGNSDASQGLGTGNDVGNTIASFIPGLGFFAKRTMNYQMSDSLKKNRAVYGNLYNKGIKAEKNSNAKLIFGRESANKMSSNADLMDTKLENIMNENTLALAASNNPYLRLQNQLLYNGGYEQGGTSMGKNGMKIDRDFIKNVKNLYSKSLNKPKEEVKLFKEGGSINVIPDGALHKNKHHMEDIDEKFEDVTSKGIPVVTEDEDGCLTQHAEVEREEIIFNIDVTNKLEKLMKEGTDEAAIEAGKLLVHEILENTVDNTGILNKIE